MAHPAFASSWQTRLLDLHAGSGSENLQGDIRVVPIDGRQRYDALSYAWEEPTKPKGHERAEIICNGTAIPITANLSCALRRLRDRNHPRRLWVDQLCINQMNYDEREQQVQYMGEIFSRALSVVVWLGDSDEETPLIWEKLQNLRAYTDFTPSQTYHLAFGWKSELFEPASSDGAFCGQTTTSFIPPELARLPPAHDQLWKSFKRFFDRAWFARLWTLQEVAVSKRCYVVCGERFMSWEDLRAASLGLQSAGYGRSVGSGNASVILRGWQHDRWNSGRRTSLRDLLGFTRSLNLKTGHSHDLVFGTLSLVSETCASKLKIQYARSLQDLFSDVARACIAEDKSLAVLGEIDLRPRKSASLASWVPDWNFPSATAVSLKAWSEQNRLFKCAGDSDPWVKSSEHGDTLILRGFRIMQITKVLKLHSTLNLASPAIKHQNLDSMRWTPQLWNDMYKQAAMKLDIPPSVVKKSECADWLSPLCKGNLLNGSLLPVEMLQIALRRTVVGDLYPKSEDWLDETMTSHSFPAFDAWRQRKFEESPPPQVLWEHDAMVKNVMFNRKAFIAGDDFDSYLGIGSRTLQEGDWICVLLGGDTPFIVRPNRCSEDSADRYKIECQLISECYVHGLMDGEAMERTKDPEFQYEDFVFPGPRPLARL